MKVRISARSWDSDLAKRFGANGDEEVHDLNLVTAEDVLALVREFGRFELRPAGYGNLGGIDDGIPYIYFENDYD